MAEVPPVENRQAENFIEEKKKKKENSLARSSAEISPDIDGKCL